MILLSRVRKQEITKWHMDVLLLTAGEDGLSAPGKRSNVQARVGQIGSTRLQKQTHQTNNPNQQANNLLAVTMSTLPFNGQPNHTFNSTKSGSIKLTCL